MLIKINVAIFGSFVLICLCDSVRLNDSVKDVTGYVDLNMTRNSTFTENGAPWNGTFPKHQQRGGRCLDTIKEWLGFVDQAIAGNPDSVRFFLYPNPIDPQYAEEILYGDTSNLQRSNFFTGFPLKIIIHGFTKNYVSEAVQEIKNAYLTRLARVNTEVGKNLILVDWESIANPKVGGDYISYRYAVANVALVGRRVGEFIQFLMENGAVKNLNDVHIIGFSLGAHVAGIAGSTLKELNAGQPPARVTGCDPAGPAFYEGISFSHRMLYKTDGKFVDVIHSNMGTWGTLNALGHVDFYPNGGGPFQQSCEREYQVQIAQNRSAATGIVDKLSTTSSCAHNKAPKFFAMSILNPNMFGCQCNSYAHFKLGRCNCNQRAVFGEFCDPRTRGKYYLDI